MRSTTTLLALLLSLGAMAQNWTELNGPFGGTISNFAFDDAGRSYVVTGTPIAGDVAAFGGGPAFVSTDAGGHWQALVLPATGVRDLATKGSTLYVLGSNQTTYTSTDGGVTWVTKGTIPFQVATYLYGIKPLPMANGVIVYGMDGMYISVDNGSTYTRFHAPFTTGWRPPSVQVASNGDIFVAEYTDGLLKYPFPANPTVAGSWTEAAWQNLLPTESVYQTDMDVAISPTDRIYVNIRSDVNGARFLSSIDHGATWQTLSNVGFTHTFNYNPHWAIAPNGRVFFIENASGIGYERTTYEFIEGAPTPWVKKAWPTSLITNQNVTAAAWRTNTQLFTGGVHDGIFISNNAAASFAPASTGIKLGKGYAVEVIPNGAGQRIVYIQGFMPQGYFYSDDDGANWTLRSSPFPGLGISELIKLPDNSLLVYAATDKDSPGYTYRSTDGINWDKSSVSHEFLDFHVVAANDIYGFTNGEGIYESIDGGETWDLIPVNGIPANGSIIQGTRDADGFVYIYMPSSDPDHWKIDTSVTPWQATSMTIPFEEGIATYVYDMFVLDNKVYLNSSQNFVSSDHGVTWNELPVSGILIPIKQGNGALGVAADGKLSITQDDGISFRNIDVPTALIRSISLTSAGDFYAAGDASPCIKYTQDLVLPPDQQAPFVPYDWKPVKGPTGGQVAKILNGPAGSFYALIPGTELLKLPSGSTTWVSTGPATVNDAFVDQSGTVFTATTNGIQKSTDGTNFSPLNYSGETYSIVRLSTGELLATVGTGMVRSVDGGATFTPVSTIYAQQFVTSSNGTVLARTGNEVYRSVNAGTTWTKCAENIPGIRSVGKLEGNVFSAGNNDFDSFRSADDGATWTSIKGNLPQTSTLAPFALADGTYVVNSFGDVYTSANKGGNWTKRSSNLPYVTSAVVSGSTLLFATAEGIVQSADFGVTSTMLNSGISAQKVLSLRMFRGRLMAIAAANTSQLVQSDDLGVTWSKVNGVPVLNRLFKVNDDLLIAYGSGIYKTIDGISWTKVSEQGVNKLATHNGSRYYATSFDQTGFIYVTSTDLVTWTVVPKAGLPASCDVLVAGANDTFYVLDDEKLYRSSFGVTTTVSFGDDVKIFSLTTQNGKVQVLWVNTVSGAQALIESADGLTWTTLPSTNGSNYIASDLNHRFMITESFASTYIRVSRDGGVNWQNISSGSLRFDDIIVDEYTGLAFGARSGPGPVYRTDKPILVDDKTAPLRVALSPSDDSQYVAIDTRLSITFNEAATPVGGKKLKVYVGLAVNPIFELDVTAGIQVNKTWTYSLPSSSLAYLTNYYVVIDNGAFKDLFGNLYAGITDQTSWTFKTIETPDTQAPGIVIPVARNLEVGTGNKEIQFNVTDNKTIDIASAKFFYGAVTSNTALTAGTLSSTGTGGAVTFKATISESDYKSVGIAFYLEVADAVGNKSRYPATAGEFDYSYLTYPASQNPTLPALAAGGKKGNYKMISLPFEFGSKQVSTLFASLGAPAPDVWRLLTHAGGATTNWLEYGDGDFSTIDRGVGYWINVKAPIEIKVPQASVPANHSGNWFTMQLKPGWNQIGNPYTVPISWEQVRTINSNIGKVKVFNAATLSYDNGDVMEKFGAGFVFLNGTAPVTVTIRFQGFTTGRKVDPGFGTDLGSDTWQLPITLTQGTSTSEFSGIGMHPDADNEMDQFDDLNPPPFLKLMEMNFDHPQGTVKKLAMDVVPTTEDYRWNFNVSTDTEEEVRLQWDNTQMGSNSKELFLFNEGDQSLTNMREQNIFTFKPVKGNRFRIYFGENLSEKIKPTKVLAGNPFPNPSNGMTTIPFTLGDNAQTYQVKMEIVDLLGRTVQHVVGGTYRPGFYNALWDAGDHNIINGFYFVRMTVESTDAREIQTRKIIIQK